MTAVDDPPVLPNIVITKGPLDVHLASFVVFNDLEPQGLRAIPSDDLQFFLGSECKVLTPRLHPDDAGAVRVVLDDYPRRIGFCIRHRIFLLLSEVKLSTMSGCAAYF